MSVPAFLAAAGDPGALRHWLSTLIPSREAPPRLNRIFDSDDLVVFASPDAPILLLEEQRGVVIGRLFRGAEHPSRVQALSLSESRHAARSSGRSLLEGLWGNYVALLRESNLVSVLRDPSGAIPCYHLRTEGLQVYFSAAGMIEELGLDAPSLDIDFVRHWLTFPFLRTARTGASGCEELLPGTVRASRGGGLRVEAAWTPWAAAGAERRIDEFGEAARRVRTIALATVGAQLADLDRPVLELSGGLDSSIVAACLSEAGLPFSACNFVTILPDGDESNYARTVASAVGVELAELIEDERPLDLSVSARRTLRPPLSPVLQPLRRALAAHAKEQGASHFVTGAGGDNLFCYLTTAAPILDALQDGGIAAGLRTLRDVAALGECSIWTAGRLAARKRFRRDRRPPWKEDRRFLTPEAAAGSIFLHPWLERPQGAAAGTIEHVESLVRVQHFLEPSYPSGEAVHHPLLNQPLTELCLAIPSWLWVKDGRNRAVARAAFSDLLPAEILRRRTKGRLESMCARAYSANHAALMGLLLGGELARLQIVDTGKVEAYLRLSGQPLDEAFYRLFDLVSVELWLRSWRR